MERIRKRQRVYGQGKQNKRKIRIRPNQINETIKVIIMARKPRMIGGLKPTPPDVDPHMARLDEINRNIDTVDRMNSKKADRYTRPL